MTEAALPKNDELRWPILVVTMPSHALADHEFAVFLDRLAEFWRRGQPFGLVIDVRSAPALIPAQRRMVADHLDQSAEKYPDMLRGVAVVLNNSVQRGIVSVLSWLTKRPFELRPFPSVELGSAWLARALVKPMNSSNRPAAGGSQA